ncbi:MAG: hypothetical protein M3Y55_11825 [Pseudomonadota bacterium]|nr:hypothetical protein [Pseudomonadota bacterium]
MSGGDFLVVWPQYFDAPAVFTGMDANVGLNSAMLEQDRRIAGSPTSSLASGRA